MGIDFHHLSILLSIIFWLWVAGLLILSNSKLSCLGHPPLSSAVIVPVRVVSTSHPIFDKNFYSVEVKENFPAESPILSLKAISPNNEKLIYSITAGDPYREFSVDFNIGKHAFSLGNKRAP